MGCRVPSLNGPMLSVESTNIFGLLPTKLHFQASNCLRNLKGRCSGRIITRGNKWSFNQYFLSKAAEWAAFKELESPLRRDLTQCQVCSDRNTRFLTNSGAFCIQIASRCLIKCYQLVEPADAE
jgi:hypothetical protein